MASGSLNETHMRSAIAKLVESKPRDYQGILVTLKRLVRLEMERKHAIVESAAPLDLEERSRAADSIIAQYGKDLTFEYKVTPELLGGLRIQVGNDVLDGGTANDTLIGGAGSDTFVFSTALAANRDTVQDFAPGVDKLRLDDDIFTALTPGVLSADAFASGRGLVAAQDATDRIIYNTTTGGLYYDADGAGGTAALQFAVLSGTPHPGLSATDILIVT
jgi:hypothetical protein